MNYAKTVVKEVVKTYGIDPDRVVLCGLSRGAIGVNYIGLSDDEIAGLWSAFVTDDHYDGVRAWDGTSWGTPLADYRKKAATRLARLKGRPVLICQNGGTADIQAALLGLKNLTFLDHDTAKILGSFPNETAIYPHTDRWLLKASADRDRAWDWMQKRVF